MVISQEVLSRAEEIADQVNFAFPQPLDCQAIPREGPVRARERTKESRILRESDPRGGSLPSTSSRRRRVYFTIFWYARLLARYHGFANLAAAIRAIASPRL